MRLFSLLALITGLTRLTVPAAAQEVDYGRYQVRLMPLRTLDPANPGVELQGEAAITRQSALQLTLAGLFFTGVIYSNDDDFERDPQTLRGGRALLGFKHYFGDEGWNRQKAERTYFLIEGGYSYADFWRIGEFSSERDPDPVFGPAPYRELYQTKRHVVLIQGRIGGQLLVRRFCLDLSVGLGVKYLDVVHINRSRPADVLVRGGGNGLNAMREQSSTYPNFPFGISLGYRFGR